MALIDNTKAGSGPIFETEGAWSDGEKNPLSLDINAWRTELPVLHVEKCTYCGLCYLYCPTQCIGVDEEYFPINHEFCKGCGICAHECPTNAIEMVPEGESPDGSSQA